MLLNCEGVQGVPGFNVTDASGNEIEVVLSGKSFHCISKEEESQELYNMIRENYDLSFCTEPGVYGFNYCPVPMVMFFAYDSFGNYFGTLNGFGNIDSHEIPVVFINKISGAYGKISENMKAFFSLANYDPDWRTILANEESGTSHDLEVLEIERKTDRHFDRNSYMSRQKAIEGALNLSKEVNAIDRLIENLRNEPGFVVYESIVEAEKNNEFIEL